MSATPEADPDPFGPPPAPVSVGQPAERSRARLPVPPPVVAMPGKPIKVTFPYPPSANRYWRTRVILPRMESIAAAWKTGGVREVYQLLTKETFVSTYPSNDGKAFKDAAGWLLKAAGIKAPLSCRVQVDIQLWPSRPQDWATRTRKDPLYWADTVQRIDLDNARKATNDALNGIAIVDDKQIWKDTGEVMEPDGREACVIVTITPLVKQPMTPENPQGDLAI